MLSDKTFHRLIKYKNQRKNYEQYPNPESIELEKVHEDKGNYHYRVRINPKN